MTKEIKRRIAEIKNGKVSQGYKSAIAILNKETFSNLIFFIPLEYQS